MNVEIEVDSHLLFIEYSLNESQINVIQNDEGESLSHDDAIAFSQSHAEEIESAVESELKRIGERENEAYQDHIAELNAAYIGNNGGW